MSGLRTGCRWAIFISVVLGSVFASRGQADPLPIYGSPGYTPGVGGYIASVGEVDGANYKIDVNDAGIAIATASRINAAGESPDIRAVRWSEAAAEVLGDVGSSGGLAFTRGTGINAAGNAAGNGTIGFGDEHALLWNGVGTDAKDLGAPAGYVGAGLQDLNDSGATIGTVYLDAGKGVQAARWDAAGTPTVLPVLPGSFGSEGIRLNNAGVALVRSFNDTDGRAVRWDPDGTVTVLGHLGLSATGTTSTMGQALNEGGTAAGYAYKFNAAGAYDGTFPVRWNAGSADAVELETPPPGLSGFRFGIPNDLNDAGVVAGYVSKSPAFPTDVFGNLAARWSAGNGALTILGTLGAAPDGQAFANAYAINSSGLIVGTAAAYNAVAAALEPRAVYWNDAGQAIDLNSLIDPNSGWLLTGAYAVSDTGWIAGDGYYDPDGPGSQPAYGRFFVLQVPEPATGWLMAIAMGLGAVGMTGRSRRYIRR